MMLPTETQQAVMAKGPLHGSRDQTAVLLQRIRMCIKSVVTGKPANDEEDHRDKIGTPLREYEKPGDWTCTSCGDLQFAKNANCRMCGAPKPGVKEAREEILKHGQSPENWIAMHPDLELRAKEKFLAMDPKLQLVVMKKGTLHGTRDPTAVLMSRIKLVLATGILPPAPEAKLQPRAEGDWTCPSCHDHQFRRNHVCRRCGTPNPALS